MQNRGGEQKTHPPFFFVAMPSDPPLRSHAELRCELVGNRDEIARSLEVVVPPAVSSVWTLLCTGRVSISVARVAILLAQWSRHPTQIPRPDCRPLAIGVAVLAVVDYAHSVGVREHVGAFPQETCPGILQGAPSPCLGEILNEPESRLAQCVCVIQPPWSSSHAN